MCGRGWVCTATCTIPLGEKPYTLFFSDTIHLKVWFASVVVVLACVQVLLGARLSGTSTCRATRRRGWATRTATIGIVAFALTLPVAYQCLWGLGFQSTDTRVLVHSILGCVFYGAFTVKVLAVRIRGLPDRTLPARRWLRVRGARRHLAHEQLLVLHVPPGRHPAVLMFKRIVNVVEVLAASRRRCSSSCCSPTSPARVGARARDAPPGATLFAENCGRCHGSDGGGGIGPQLSDGKVVKDFPKVYDQIAFVRTGQDGMPGFGDQLSTGGDPAGGGIHRAL